MSSSQSQNPQPVISKEQLEPINAIVDEAIREGKIPGALLLIGNQGKVVYRRGFGFRTLVPEKLPMPENTIFDIASLTKVVATTTAIMQLVEKGKLRLDAPVARYWPAFKTNGKGRITVRQLLTHYSGLQPELKLKHKWSGYRKAMKMIVAERPVSPPGTSYIYSDINFEILGEIVRRVSGKPLDVYCADRIFKPLGMIDTGFKPSPALQDRIAPTQSRKGKLLCGEVHDPTCYNMGGIAGHAGLFSTADDLSVFSQMLLNGGSFHGVRILSPPTVEEMTIPQSPPGKAKLRGLGWDLDAPFSSNREQLFQVGSYGHLGYTGTAIWIDPVTQTYIILLTNRVHQDGGGDVKELRAEIKKIVADALGPLSSEQVLARRPLLNNYYELMKRYADQDKNNLK
ncbi:MAG TPA: serine hydrolase domain-containing protein [Thermodesulfovibrionales bacterium]|nr:serine hydrolase domain-containing protein [Thermodesulfovibrionales bacterium]